MKNLPKAPREFESVPANRTFTRDVLPIFQKSCQDCHRPDGSLISDEEYAALQNEQAARHSTAERQ